jgi:glycerophosphoryl diester phosphodiesterase
MVNLNHPLYCIAHRGGRRKGSNSSENTLGAFAKSIALGVDAIEVDVWQVGGQLLVTHDRRLGKTLPGKGRLLDHTPNYLRNLEMECGGRIPTLQEVLESVGEQVALNIELKGPGCAQLVARTLEQFVRDSSGTFEQYIFSSFDHHQLFHLKQSLPQVKRGVLIEGIPLTYARCCEPLEAYSFHPNVDFINQALVDDAKQRGLKVWVYTVNEIDDFCHLSAMGVDGVFTDYPERLLKLNKDLHWQNVI